MDWLSLSDTAATVIVGITVGVSTVAASLGAALLTPLAARKSDEARRAHERDMRLLEERIRITREIAGHIAAIDAHLGEHSQMRIDDDVEWLDRYPMMRHASQAIALSWQLADSELIQAIRTFELSSTVVFFHTGPLGEQMYSSEERSKSRQSYRKDHERVVREIGRVSEVATRLSGG